MNLLGFYDPFVFLKCQYVAGGNMGRTHIRHIKFRSCFPSGDRLATCVVRLSILREDMMLELLGLDADSIEALDGNSSSWRRLYFWRNSLRTLVEIRETLNTLNSLAEFRVLLCQESQAFQDAYESLKKNINKACNDFLYELRCTIAAHIDEESIQAALDNMDWDRIGLIEVGETVGKTHYKFAGELLLSVLLGEVPPKDTIVKLEEILGGTASLIPALNTIDAVLSAYMRRRIPV